MNVLPHFRRERKVRPENRVAGVDLVVCEPQDLLSGQRLRPVCTKNHVAHDLQAAFADNADLPVDTFYAFVDIVHDLLPKPQDNAEIRGIIGDELVDLTPMPSKLDGTC